MSSPGAPPSHQRGKSSSGISSSGAPYFVRALEVDHPNDLSGSTSEMEMQSSRASPYNAGKTRPAQNTSFGAPSNGAATQGGATNTATAWSVAEEDEEVDPALRAWLGPSVAARAGAGLPGASINAPPSSSVPALSTSGAAPNAIVDPTVDLNTSFDGSEPPRRISEAGLLYSAGFFSTMAEARNSSSGGARGSSSSGGVGGDGAGFTGLPQSRYGVTLHTISSNAPAATAASPSAAPSTASANGAVGGEAIVVGDPAASVLWIRRVPLHASGITPAAAAAASAAAPSKPLPARGASDSSLAVASTAGGPGTSLAHSDSGSDIGSSSNGSGSPVPLPYASSLDGSDGSSPPNAGAAPVTAGAPPVGTRLPPDPSSGVSESVPAAITRILRQQYASLLYLGGEARRQPKGYALGWFIVFLVVVFIAILINAVVQSPLIFYRLSEVQAGESDMISYPGAGIDQKVITFPQPVPLLDMPLFSNALPNQPSPDAVEGVAGVAGRWLMLGQVKHNISSGASPLESANAIVLGIDTEQEAKLGLGRTWTLPPVPAGSTYLSRSIVTQLQLDRDTIVGTKLVLSIDPSKMLAQFGIVPPPSSAEGAGQDFTDEQARAFLEQIAPQIDWATAYSTPFFTGEETTFSVSSLVDVQAFGDLVMEQMKRIPAVNQELETLDTVTVRLTLRDLNTIFGSAVPPPYTVTYPNGVNVTLTNPLPPPFPDDSVNPVELKFDKKSGTQEWIVDEARFDQSIRDAIGKSGPSETTVGQYVTFFLPVILGATRVAEPLTVAHVLGSPDGKFAENVGAVAVVESSFLLQLLRGSILSAFTNSFTFTAAPGTVDVSIFVNNADIIGPGREPIVIPPTPVETPAVSFKMSFPALMILSGTPPEQVALFLMSVESFAAALTADKYAPTITVQMTNRREVYLQAEKSLDRSMLSFTDTVALKVGVQYPSRVLLPLLEVIRGTLAIRYFLDNIFNAVIALVAALGALLVFSLLLNDVETKTYEYGMLRALGMRKSNLVQILLSKGFLFSVLGVGTGLLIAFLVSMPITDLLTDFAKVTPIYRMDPTAAIVATCVGIIMPALANIIPISRALSKTLRDSLDVYHHVVSDVTVTMVRLADLGLDMWQTAVALLLIAIGFMTFYLIPLAFINNNIPMFLGLLMAILIAMLLGLALLAQIVQPFLERGLLSLLMLPFHSNLTALVRKSLSAHRPRNSKTAQMFTISLAFVVFAGVMFALQATSLADNLRILIGAPLVVKAPNLAEALREQDMIPYLEAQVSLTRNGSPDGILTAYSFVSFPAASSGVVRYSRFNNLAENPQQRQRIYGIQQSFYDSIYSSYYQDVETSTGKVPAIVGIFTDAGNARLPVEEGHRKRWVPDSVTTSLSRLKLTDIHTDVIDAAEVRRKQELNETYSDYVDAICSEGLRNVISIDTKTAASIRLQAKTRSPRTNSFSRTYFTKVRGMVKHVPGFFFSSYPTIVSRGSALVREDQFLRMLNDASPNAPFDTVPKERLMLNVRSSATGKQRDDLVAGIRGYFSSDDVTVTDTQRLVESTSFALSMLNVFFVIVGVLAMVLCFVILWLSFTANVQENAWEFGVLRAVGLNTKQVVMTYIYEALALVLTCVILGTLIGLVIAISLTLQFNLFTEVAFKMEFPFLLYFLLFGMALVVAIVASAIPAYVFIQRSVAETLRRT